MTDNRRILIVDDNEAIHRDFQNILNQQTSETTAVLNNLENELFGESTPTSTPKIQFELDSAYQGQEALARVELAMASQRPYALIFMDVRMPPGWDGIETIDRIWARFPDIEVVICTAYSDYSLDAIHQKLGDTDHLLFLRKPFDHHEVKQMALTLTRKWSLNQQLQQHINELEYQVADRTRSLKKAKDEATAANHAKTNFMINISHQLRSSLNAILGYTSFLEFSLDPEYHRDLQKIEQAGQQLLDSTQDILHLCKMEAGALNLTIEQFDFFNLLDDMVTDLTPSLPPTTTINIDNTKNIGIISHDVKQLWQLFHNILKQMILWTKQGNITFSTEKNELLLYVKIIATTHVKQSEIDNLLQDYSLLSDDQQTKHLGLAISQRFCRLIGGYFNIEHINNQGVVASIHLPLHLKQA